MCISAGLLLAGSSLLQGVGAYRAGSQQADAELDAGRAEAGKIRKAGQRQTGEARAQLGASGVLLDTGTAGLVTDEIMAEAESDAANTELAAARRARAAKTAGKAALVGGLLSAGAAVASGWKGQGGPTRTNDMGVVAKMTGAGKDPFGWWLKHGVGAD